MNVVRKCILDMTGYIPGEPADNQKIIKLNQNESRFPPSPRAIKAIEAAAADLALYPDSTSTSLRETAARIYGVAPGQVMVGNGSDELLRILFQCCCDPGDEAVAFYPSYTYYATLAAMQDAKYRLIDFEGEYAIPAKPDIGRAKLVFIPNPNAPTGTIFPESEIRRLAEAAPNSLVVVDEAYADFSGQTALPLLKEYENIVVVRTFSKSYGFAGLRVGLCFAREALLEQMEKVRDYYNLDRLAQAGAEAALLDQDWLKLICSRVIDVRETLTGQLRELGLKVYDSGANFILIRFGGQERARRVFDALRERNILTRYFNSRGIDDCLRVTIGTETDMDVFRKELEDIIAKEA